MGTRTGTRIGTETSTGLERERDCDPERVWNGNGNENGSGTDKERLWNRQGTEWNGNGRGTILDDLIKYY